MGDVCLSVNRSNVQQSEGWNQLGPSQCRLWKETGSQVLGSWNKEARANSHLYRVRGAVTSAVLTSQCSYPICTPGYELRVLTSRCVEMRVYTRQQ